MNPNVDLRQLAVRRDGQASSAPAHRRHLLTRYVFPGAVLLGFLGLLAWTLRDNLLPAKSVTVVPVLTTRSEAQQEGTPLFQAAGWVEPRPTPMVVTALAEGVVDKLLVVEGQEVRAGEPVARLIDTDARLALETSEIEVNLHEAEHESALAQVEAARTNIAHPVYLQAALADANAMLAKMENELACIPFQIRVAESKQWLARTSVDSKTTETSPALRIRQAQSELEMATASLEELKGRKLYMARETEALANKRDALQKQLELKTEEKRKLAEATAAVKVSEVHSAHARVEVATAKLRLERMTVKAPQAGRVLALVARPGTRLMGLVPGTYQESGTVVTLYDPHSLQVRADVPLDQVQRVTRGQPVRIETDAVAGSLEGEVLFKTSQADIQKNTLQVKVAIKTPPPDLKPDMLVRVTFLAPASADAKTEPSERFRLLVPRQLVVSGDGGASVWLADQAAGVARKRTVKLGPAQNDELIEVVEGLTVTDKLIAGGREDLRDGERIKVSGEEAAPSGMSHAKPPSATRSRRPGTAGAENPNKP